MNMEIVGRHALLFDDDAMLTFINTSAALLPWNSLLIDRYDVRHLLQDLPKRRKSQPSSSPSILESGVSEADLDYERYLDLPANDDQEHEGGKQGSDSGSYRAVAFSYGVTDASVNLTNSSAETESCTFRPPFNLPDSIIKNIPPSEKLHMIIAKTAKFVSEHGGQSEIVLRVKQGNNPTFGFLMPDHYLHPYFSYLRDHPELLKAESEFNEGNDKIHQTSVVANGALSLLGTVYGSVEEDEDSTQADQINRVDEVNKSSHKSIPTKSSLHLSTSKNILTTKYAGGSINGKVLSVKKNHSVSAVFSAPIKVGVDNFNSRPKGKNKEEVDVLGLPQNEPLILEPQSELKRKVEKIVEFILRNGKEFEAVLVDQDRKIGRFPFLLPANQYHAYYLKVLHDAQEGKLPWKSMPSKRIDFQSHSAIEKKSRESTLSDGDDDAKLKELTGYIPSEGLYDSMKKKKFQMVLGGSKKDTQDTSSKSSQPQGGVSVDAAAAIVLAATRGFKKPEPEHTSKSIQPHNEVTLDDAAAIVLAATRGQMGSKRITSSNNSTDPRYSSFSIDDVKETSSIGTLSMPCPTISKSVSDAKSSLSMPDKGAFFASTIAKTAALAAASEADSSEASLTKEQKQKAERLKRAKMFATMIRSGNHQSMISSQLSRPTLNLDSVSDGSAQATRTSSHQALREREREGSSAPADIVASDEMKPKIQDSDGEYDKARKKEHRSRSRRVDESGEVQRKHSRKKHHSRRSSHCERDSHKRRKHHSSSKEESRHRCKHRYISSSDDEDHHRSKSSKRSRSHKDNKTGDDEDEREISLLKGTRDHDDSVHVSNVLLKPSSTVDRQSSDAPEVSDDLRSKVRAMLLATM